MKTIGPIAFIGAGNMTSALIEGLVRSGSASPADLTANDVRQEALQVLAERHGIRVARDRAQAIAGARAVILCVKPQTLPQLLPDLGPQLPPQPLVVSIAAGVPTAALEAPLPEGTRVVRAMPNTPALVQAGATGIAGGRHATPADMALAKRLFDSVGITVTVEERLMDAVTAVSGSGPAYVFRFAEALITAGTAAGLRAEDATLLATQTLYGAAKLLREQGESVAVLRQRVTSPGGTTAAGLAALERAAFVQTIADCVQAAIARGQELGRAAAAPRDRADR